jgi:AraC-like DNA-binding protein
MAEGGSPNSEYGRRVTIINCLRAGRTHKEIADFTGIPLRTVQRVAAQHAAAEEAEAGSYTAERKIHDRTREIRTPQLIDRVQMRVLEDPSITINELAREFEVSETTMRRLVHEDLRYSSYVLKVRQMLTENAKIRRLERCRLLLSSLKNEAAGRLRFFSDEKYFTTDPKINRRNDRWLAHDPQDVPVIGTTKFPASLHVLSVVSSEGDVMPPHFFQKGETVTKEVYLRVLQAVVKPWMDKVSHGRPYVFQQDNAPAHTSHLVQDWLSEHVSMFWDKNSWPSNSPDLNPLDYFVWSVVERESNKSRHANIESLAKAIQKAFKNLDRDVLKNACERFRSRIEKVISVSGSYIE